MARPKTFITEYEVEELLKAIENEKVVTKESYTLNPVLSFCQIFKITPGKYPVKTSLLYRIFKLSNIESPIKQTAFTEKLKELFQNIKKSSNTYVFINIKTFDISKIATKLKEKKTRKYTSSKHWHNHFQAFMQSTSLEEGSVFVEADILYYIYNRWCNENKRNPIGERNFSQLCQLFFEYRSYMDNDMYFYGVNENVKKIIKKEEVARWREGRKKGAARKNGYQFYEKSKGFILYEETEQEAKERIPSTRPQFKPKN